MGLTRTMAGPQPWVSIVMTAYNAAPFLTASSAAALGQCYPSFEVIVVDDGSSDETEAVCRAIVDPRYRYLKRPRLGRARALNEAIVHAVGEYIAINDADDLSFPGRVAYAVGFLRANPSVALVGTAYAETATFQARVPDHLLRETASRGTAIRLAPMDLYRRNRFVHSTVVFAKGVWSAVGGYDEQLELCVDYDFSLRALRYGDAAWLPEPTLLYYRNPGSFFKRKTAWEYLRTMAFIKRRARRVLGLPRWAAFFDLVPIYQTVWSSIIGSLSGASRGMRG